MVTIVHPDCPACTSDHAGGSLVTTETLSASVAPRLKISTTNLILLPVKTGPVPTRLSWTVRSAAARADISRGKPKASAALTRKRVTFHRFISTSPVSRSNRTSESKVPAPSDWQIRAGMVPAPSVRSTS